jgi:hypothetical protein
MTSPQYRRQFDNARTPYDARNALGITSVGGGSPPYLTDAPSNSHYYGRYNSTWANLDEVYMRWVPYTGPPQSFLKQDLTRDGDWTMVALADTTDRPAPQASGTEEDLLPIWTPATSSNPANYTVYNEWTVNTSGWIDQYGGDVLNQNTGKQHVITLSVNGVVKDTFTATPNTAQLYWHDITPLIVLSGAVIRVTAAVSGSGNLYWYQQTGLFATPPVYCSLAVGSKDGAAAGTTAYGCHLLFTPGTKSPNWDVVAYGGAAAGGGSGGAGGNVSNVGTPVANQWAQWTDATHIQGVATASTPFVQKAGDTMTGDLSIAKANPLVTLNKASSGQSNIILSDTNSVPRWQLALGDGTAESGSNAGSNVALTRFNDAGAAIDNPIAITRSTGLATVIGDPTAALGIATKQYVDNLRGITTVAITRYTSGSGTFTPNAATKIMHVRLVGGGGGGGGTSAGTSGGNTTFGALTAGGGGNGTAAAAPGGGGTASGGNVLNAPGNGGWFVIAIGSNTAGGNGGASPFNGGGTRGGTYGAGEGASANSYGCGGGGAGAVGSLNAGSGAGSGGCVEHIYSPPSGSYSYAVGAAGGAGTNGGAGGTGLIVIEEYQ